MVKPNLRIKKVFNRVVENGGVGIGKIMIEEGYSPNTAHTPQKITESKTWEQLLEHDLPDSLLTQVAQEGLNATMVKSSMTEPDRVLPDYAVRQRYLETSLKMKGKITEKKDLNLHGDSVIVLPEQKLNDERSRLLDSPSGTTDGSTNSD